MATSAGTGPPSEGDGCFQQEFMPKRLGTGRSRIDPPYDMPLFREHSLDYERAVSAPRRGWGGGPVSVGNSPGLVLLETLLSQSGPDPKKPPEANGRRSPPPSQLRYP